MYYNALFNSFIEALVGSSRGRGAIVPVDAKINRVQQAKPYAIVLDDYHTCDMPDDAFAYG